MSLLLLNSIYRGDDFPKRGLVATWDASVRTSITDSGGEAVTWTDTFAGNVANRPGGVTGPTVDIEEQNGLHALGFVNADERWMEGDVVADIANNPFAIQWVFKMGDFLPIGEDIFLCIGGFHTVTGANVSAYLPGTRGKMDYLGGTGIGDPLPYGTLENDNWYSLLMSFDATGIDVYLNGIFLQRLTGDPFTDTSTTFSFGQDFDAGSVPSQFYQGAIGQVNIWSNALLKQEADLAQSNMLDKWAITPAVLPYTDINEMRWWLDASQEITKNLNVPLVATDGIIWIKERSLNQLQFDNSGPNEVQNNPDGLNTLTTMLFDGIDTLFDLPDSTHPVGNQAYSIVLLARMNVEDAGAIFLIASSGATNLVVSRSSTDLVRMGNSNDFIAGSGLDEGFTIITCTYDPAVGRKLYLNSLLVASDTFVASNIGVDSNRIGINSIFLDMAWAEGICVDFTFDQVQVDDYHAYLVNKWGPLFPIDTSPRLWLDAKEPSTIILISDRVSEWLDKSGNSLDATMTTASQRPIVDTKDGLVGIAPFDSSSFMDIPDSTLPTGNSSYTIIAVINPNVFSNGDVIIGDGNSTTTNARLFFVVDGDGVFRIGWWTNNLDGNALSLDALEIIGTEYESGGDRTNFDSTNTNVATDTPGVRNSQATGQQIFNADNGSLFDGLIHELFVWNRVLSTQERSAIMTYLNEKWVPVYTFDSDRHTFDSSESTYDNS